MKKATIITIIAVAALAAGYFYFGTAREKYDYPLNVIEKIKYFEPVHKTDAYHPLTLTPAGYSRTPFSQSITAKAVYKGETIGLKIIYRRRTDKIEFRSIGAESDRFARALAELYDEQPADKMRRRIPTRMGTDSGWWTDLRHTMVNYKLIAGSEAGMSLSIDIPGGKITLGDRRSGLAKKRFADAFAEK